MLWFLLPHMHAAYPSGIQVPSLVSLCPSPLHTAPLYIGISPP
jgi:hypothetical protein